jgi:GT2 family glycosyltransferase
MHASRSDILGIPCLRWHGRFLKKYENVPFIASILRVRRKCFRKQIKAGEVDSFIKKVCSHEYGKACGEAIKQWLGESKKTIPQLVSPTKINVAKYRCSVIISTVDRAKDLELTLNDLHRIWNYAEDELIIVLGPTNDGSEDTIKASKIPCKLLYCSERNLAISRNLGCEAAEGKYLAFIDDDASPAEGWLDLLLEPLNDDPDVGCSAGFIMDGKREKFLSQYVVADTLGRAYYLDDILAAERKIIKHGLARAFITATGCNMAFKRSVLDRVGGFDPYYKYFLEETDLVNRAKLMGYRCVPAPKSIVYHRLSSNGVRNQTLNIHDLITVMLSQIHYIDKFGKSTFSEFEISQCLWQRIISDLEKIAWKSRLNDLHMKLQMEYLYSITRELKSS